jgi:hypothetical protein
MGFQQLGWFPTKTTDTVATSIQPVHLDNRDLYPGDTFIDSADDTLYFVLETRFRNLNDCVKLLPADAEDSITKRDEELQSLIERSIPHQSCLAYTTHHDPTMEDLVHLYLSVGHSPDGDRVYYAWWDRTAPNSLAASPPTTTSRSDPAVITDTFAELKSALQDRPKNNGVNSLSKLIDDVPSIDDTIDTAIESATTVHKSRFGTPKMQHERDEESSYHTAVKSIPTTSNSGGIHLDSGETVYSADRFYVEYADGELSGFAAADDDSACLNEAEHLVVISADKDSVVEFATLYFHYADEYDDFTTVELQEIFETIASEGGRSLQCLGREAHVEILGEKAPYTVSIHVYFVTEWADGEASEYYLLAYDIHHDDEVLLENPLALRTRQIETYDELVAVLEDPLSHEDVIDEEMLDWISDDEDIATLWNRVASTVQTRSDQREHLRPNTIEE